MAGLALEAALTHLVLIICLKLNQKHVSLGQSSLPGKEHHVIGNLSQYSVRFISETFTRLSGPDVWHNRSTSVLPPSSLVWHLLDASRLSPRPPPHTPILLPGALQYFLLVVVLLAAGLFIPVFSLLSRLLCLGSFPRHTSL